MINMFRLYAKMKLLPALAAVSLLFLAAGCNQDSIFDDISWETAPTQPKIKGSPSKMALANFGNGDKIYIANGRLWEYDLLTGWGRIGAGGYVGDVASTTDGNNKSFAYALDVDSARVSKTDDGTNWEAIAPPDATTGYGAIQHIFGAGDTLFATGANQAGDNAILYCKQDESKFALLKKSDGTVLSGADLSGAVLSGAGKVGTDYYLAARGKGIYKVNSSGFTATLVAEASIPDPPPGANDKFPIPGDIMGLFQADTDTVIGISGGGHIFYIDPSITISTDHIQSLGFSVGGGAFTGALALMNNPDLTSNFKKLLLLGYRDASYRHGYVEVLFNSTDGTHGGARIPGADQPSSIVDDDRKDQQYTSSLRRYPVTALWVLDPTAYPSVIFAATTNQGLYSYRYRSDGGWQWNHEE
jgi:hypothetical protein